MVGAVESAFKPVHVGGAAVQTRSCGVSGPTRRARPPFFYLLKVFGKYYFISSRGAQDLMFYTASSLSAACVMCDAIKFASTVAFLFEHDL